MKLFLKLFIAFLSITTLAQRYDHLVPVKSFLIDESFDGKKKIYDKLLKRTSRLVKFQFLSDHAFLPEEYLQLDFSKVTKQWYILYRTSNANVSRYPKDYEPIIEEYEKEVETPFAENFFELSEKVLKTTKYVEESKGYGYKDGIYYYFVTNGLIQRSGYTFIPAENSRIEKYLKLIEDLILVVKSEDTIDESLIARVEDIKKLF